jgi:hypothetical protein
MKELYTQNSEIQYFWYRLRSCGQCMGVIICNNSLLIYRHTTLVLSPRPLFAPWFIYIITLTNEQVKYRRIIG